MQSIIHEIRLNEYMFQHECHCRNLPLTLARITSGLLHI